MRIGRAKKQQSVPNRRRSVQSSQSTESTPKTKSNFRQGRTLTGSSSNDVRSTNEQHASLMSPRAHVHHLHKRRRHLFIRLVVVCVGLLVTYLFVSQLIATVDIKVQPANNQLSSALKDSYQQRVTDYFNEQPFQRVYPSLQEQKLLAFMQKEYPEIKDVSVKLTGEFGRAQTVLTLREPVVRWTIGEKNEFVDAEGVVFGNNGYLAPAIEIVDKNGTTVTNKNLVTSHRFLAFVGRIVGDMKIQEFEVRKATIPTLTTRQVEVALKGVPYRFKMTIDRPVGEQVEDAVRITRYLRKNNLNPSYVDVRVEGKAFYK